MRHRLWDSAEAEAKAAATAAADRPMLSREWGRIVNTPTFTNATPVLSRISLMRPEAPRAPPSLGEGWKNRGARKEKRPCEKRNSFHSELASIPHFLLDAVVF